MKKSIKCFFSTLLAFVTFLSVGCSSPSGAVEEPSGGFETAGTTEQGETQNTKTSTEALNLTDPATTTETTNVTTTAEGEGESEQGETEAPTQIDLSGGNLTAKNLLTTNGFGTSDRLFSSIRFGTTVNHGSTVISADATKNSYGWPTLYLGVKEDEEDYYNLSQATDLYVFLKNYAGTTPKIKWRAVDADGTVQKLVDYTNDKGDFRSFTGSTVTMNANSDGYGSYVSTTDAGIFLHSTYPSDAVLDADNQYASGADSTFDNTKVVAFMLSIMSYGIKTFDVGSISAKIGGKEVVLWDADEASEKKYADIFTEEENSFSDFSLNKNEWYLGAIPAGLIDNNPTEDEWTSDKIGVVADYYNAEALQYTYKSDAKQTVLDLYADDGLNYIKNSAKLDLSACNALVFYADFTKVKGTNNLDFTIRPTKDGTTEIIYYSQERAILLSDDGSFSTCNANALPAGFKGKVIIPFTSFKTTAGSLLSDSAYLNNVLRVTARLLYASGAYEEGDSVVINDIKVMKVSDEELAVYDKLKQYTLKFEMQSEATLSEDPFGIYFGVTAGNKYHNELIAAFEAIEGLTYEFGMIIVPNTDTYASAKPHDSNILTVVKENSGEVSETYYYVWYAGIKDIGASCYQMEFTARAYVQYTLNGEVYRIWATTADNGASLYGLCSEVSAEERTDAMQAVINSVNGVDGNE